MRVTFLLNLRPKQVTVKVRRRWEIFGGCQCDVPGLAIRLQRTAGFWDWPYGNNNDIDGGKHLSAFEQF